MKVERLHLIVHPGFITDSEESRLRRSQSPEGASEIMQVRYAERISRMLPTEVAIGMLHMEPSRLRALPRGSFYARFIEEIRDRLGNRVIMLDQSKSVSDDEWISSQFKAAVGIAKARGYEITPDTQTVAFGETLLCCVPNCAERVNTAGRFNEKTIIDADGCDIGIPGGIDAEEALLEIPKLQPQFPHTQFAMHGHTARF